MIVLATAPWLHTLGDIAAWSSAAAAAHWQGRRWPGQMRQLSRTATPGYFLVLALGSVAGAWLVGSANSLPGSFIPSHSIAGALAGGIVGVETWKWRMGIRQSTGGAFVLPLCVGIIVGRLGCLFAGLPDQTFGIPTSLPWAVDLGDGIGRHPVQLYESITMALFLVIYLRARFRKSPWTVRHGFHVMIFTYSAQRFGWEFLKPYPLVIGPFNVFHLLMLGLMIYGFIWLRRDEGESAAGSAAGAQGGALHLP